MQRGRLEQCEVIFASVLSTPGLAEDTQLPALRAALLATKHAPDPADRVRGASPQLTIAKHQLPDWAESRLKSLPFRGDGAEFARLLEKVYQPQTIREVLVSSYSRFTGPYQGPTALKAMQDLWPEERLWTRSKDRHGVNRRMNPAHGD